MANPDIEAALRRILDAQSDINAALSEDDLDPDTDEPIDPPSRLQHIDGGCPRLTAADVGGLLAVTYFGSTYEGWPEALEALADPAVAPWIGSLKIDGPDEGANGMATWDFASLIARAPAFPRLTQLTIPQSDTGDHNQKAIEDDQSPALLALMPRLTDLVLPQPPEPGFFDLDLPDLQRLRTGRDFRTRGFIGRLAEAKRLPRLHFFDFSDSLSPVMEVEPGGDAEWNSTPMEDYLRLFRSSFMDQIRAARLRNTRLSETQFQELRALRPDVQLSVALDAPHVYVAHWGATNFPHAHLLLS